MSKKRYEYMTLTAIDINTAIGDEDINRAGSDGWRLCAAYWGGHGHGYGRLARAIFVRTIRAQRGRRDLDTETTT